MPNKKPVKAARKASKPKAKATANKRVSNVSSLPPAESMWVTGLAVSFTTLCIIFAVVVYWQYGR